jgi:hypothetical protein
MLVCGESTVMRPELVEKYYLVQDTYLSHSCNSLSLSAHSGGKLLSLATGRSLSCCLSLVGCRSLSLVSLLSHCCLIVSEPLLSAAGLQVPLSVLLLSCCLVGASLGSRSLFLYLAVGPSLSLLVVVLLSPWSLSCWPQVSLSLVSPCWLQVSLMSLVSSASLVCGRSLSGSHSWMCTNNSQICTGLNLINFSYHYHCCHIVVFLLLSFCHLLLLLLLLHWRYCLLTLIDLLT